MITFKDRELTPKWLTFVEKIAKILSFYVLCICFLDRNVHQLCNAYDTHQCYLNYASKQEQSTLKKRLNLFPHQILLLCNTFLLKIKLSISYKFSCSKRTLQKSFFAIIFVEKQRNVLICFEAKPGCKNTTELLIWNFTARLELLI